MNEGDQPLNSTIRLRGLSKILSLIAFLIAYRELLIAYRNSYRSPLSFIAFLIAYRSLIAYREPLIAYCISYRSPLSLIAFLIAYRSPLSLIAFLIAYRSPLSLIGNLLSLIAFLVASCSPLSLIATKVQNSNRLFDSLTQSAILLGVSISFWLHLKRQARMHVKPMPSQSFVKPADEAWRNLWENPAQPTLHLSQTLLKQCKLLQRIAWAAIVVTVVASECVLCMGCRIRLHVVSEA